MSHRCLKLTTQTSFFAITQHCNNFNPMLEDGNLYGAKLRNYRSYRYAKNKGFNLCDNPITLVILVQIVLNAT